MQYFNDFTQYPLATKLDGGSYDWTRLAGDTDWTFQTVADARGVSGVALHLQRASTSRPLAYWSWDEVPDTDAGEIYIEFVAGDDTTTAATARSGFLAPLCSVNSDATAAYAGYDRAGGTPNVVPVIRIPASATNAGVVSGTSYAFETNRARKVVLRWSTSGSNVTLNYKTWWSSESEPGSWSVTTTQSTHPGLGAVGINRVLADNIPTRVLAYGVGTGTDTAPRSPISTGPTASFAVTAADATFSGSGYVRPMASFAVTAANATFSGSASSGSASATINGTAENATFSGSATGDTSSGVITTPALKNNAGTVLSNETGVTAYIYNPTTGALVVKKTGQTTDASGILTVTDALIAAGTQYRVVIVLGSGAEGMDKITAS